MCFTLTTSVSLLHGCKQKYTSHFRRYRKSILLLVWFLQFPTANILLHLILIGLNIEQPPPARSHLDKSTYCNLQTWCMMHTIHYLWKSSKQNKYSHKTFLHKLSKLNPWFSSKTVLIILFSAVTSSHIFRSQCPSCILWSRLVVKLRLNLKSQLSDWTWD